jgi:tetratricopeptide (TPR) repeat protein
MQFEGRIHEQILAAIRRANGEVAWTDLYVVHSGSDQTPEGKERKLQRDLHLLHLEYKEQPAHPFTLFNLGMTYADCERFEEAADYLRRSIRHSGEGDSHLRKAYALLVFAEMRLKRLDEAAATCKRARELFPEDAELRFRHGVLLHEQGCLTEAARAYAEVLHNHEERHFSSLDRGLTGFKARQNLAVVMTELGELEPAEDQWRRIIEEVPRYRAAWRGLADNLLRQGQIGSVEQLAIRVSFEEGMQAEELFMEGRAAQAREDLATARARFEAAIAERPSDPELWHALAQLLFETGQSADAERALLELVRLQPNDASAHHNLGTLYLHSKRPKEAVQAYRESLKHRPDAPATWLHLGQALKESGRAGEAVSAWERVLQLDPGNEAAAQELERIRAPKSRAGSRGLAIVGGSADAR